MNLLKDILTHKIPSALTLLLIFVVAFSSGSALVYAAISYRAPISQVTNVNEWSICRNINNHSVTGLDMFAPTKTQGEWVAAVNNPPTGVAMNACGGSPACPAGYYTALDGSCLPNPGPGGGQGGNDCTYGGSDGQGGFYITINGILYHTHGPVQPNCP